MKYRNWVLSQPMHQTTVKLLHPDTCKIKMINVQQPNSNISPTHSLYAAHTHTHSSECGFHAPCECVGVFVVHVLLLQNKNDMKNASPSKTKCTTCNARGKTTSINKTMNFTKRLRGVIIQ